MMKTLKRMLSREIAIEFKACVYAYGIIAYYCLYKILAGSRQADIIVLIEMLCIAYVMGHIQVHLMDNFDEAEHIGLKESIFVLLCSAIYTGCSYIFHWFDASVAALVLFYGYMICCYITMYLVYKIKRNIDTKELNKDLLAFKASNVQR